MIKLLNILNEWKLITRTEEQKFAQEAYKILKEKGYDYVDRQYMVNSYINKPDFTYEKYIDYVMDLPDALEDPIELDEYKLKRPPLYYKGQILMDSIEVLEVAPDYETASKMMDEMAKKYEDDYINIPSKNEIYFHNLGPDAENQYWYLLKLGYDDKRWWENEGYIQFRIEGFNNREND